jgi:hypothetical protein
MRGKHAFLWGIGTGFVITWAYHHFVKPLPGGAKGALAG